MRNKTYKEILKQYDRLLLVTAIILTLVLIMLYAFIDMITSNAITIELIRGLIIEFLPIGIVFCISYIIFRGIQKYREQQLIEDLSSGVSNNLIPELQSLFIKSNTNSGYYLASFTSINWEELLTTAIHIDIFVHYFDTWIRNNDRLLESVLRKGGRIRIIVPNSENKPLIKMIKLRFPEYDEKEVENKVEKTIEKLQLIQTHAESGLLQTFVIDELGYYCGIRIDDKILVLSYYDHIRDSMKIESPVLIIKLSKERVVADWFEKEFVGLIKRSKLIE